MHINIKVIGHLSYIKGLSEKIEKECKVFDPEKLKLAFRPSRTMRQTLVRVKNKIPPEKKKGVVYEVPCQDCGEVYVGETGRTLKKRISEHKQAVKKGDRKNGITVHVMDKGHTINWEEANVRTSETGYWRRRVQKAIKIQR